MSKSSDFVEKMVNFIHNFINVTEDVEVRGVRGEEQIWRNECFERRFFTYY